MEWVIIATIVVVVALTLVGQVYGALLSVAVGGATVIVWLVVIRQKRRFPRILFARSIPAGRAVIEAGVGDIVIVQPPSGLVLRKTSRGKEIVRLRPLCTKTTYILCNARWVTFVGRSLPLISVNVTHRDSDSSTWCVHVVGLTPAVIKSFLHTQAISCPGATRHRQVVDYAV